MASSQSVEGVGGDRGLRRRNYFEIGSVCPPYLCSVILVTAQEKGPIGHLC